MGTKRTEHTIKVEPRSFWCLHSSLLTVYDGGREAPSAETTCTQSHTHRFSCCRPESGWALRDQSSTSVSETGSSAKGADLPHFPPPAKPYASPDLGSEQSGSLTSTCGKSGTSTQPGHVHRAQTVRISSIRRNLMAKRRVQHCLCSDKNGRDWILMPVLMNSNFCASKQQRLMLIQMTHYA